MLPAMDLPTNPTDVLYSVARAVLLADTLQEVIDEALRGAGTLIPVWRTSVGLIDREAGTFTVYAAAGEGASARPPGKAVPIDQFGADLTVLAAGRCDLVQDVQQRPDSLGGLQGSCLRGQLIVPLLHEGELIGSLNLGADRPRAFESWHEALALELGGLVASALGRVRLREELARSLEAATAANRAKALFLANMSHELRTPLNVIIGYTELLSEEAETDVADDLQRIHSAADHLLGVVTDVLDLSKVESGQLDVASHPVDLTPLVQGLAPSLAGLVEARGSQLSVHVASLGVPVPCDARRVRQIVYNLVANAARFTEDGEVGLELSTDGEMASVTVRDTGIGIGAEDLPHIFQPFTQVHAPEGHTYGGSGLGLAISRQYARAMGGELSAESELGVGSAFTLTLPYGA